MNGVWYLAFVAVGLGGSWLKVLIDRYEHDRDGWDDSDDWEDCDPWAGR